MRVYNKGLETKRQKKVDMTKEFIFKPGESDYVITLGGILTNYGLRGCVHPGEDCLVLYVDGRKSKINRFYNDLKSKKIEIRASRKYSIEDRGETNLDIDFLKSIT